ncbi:CoxG family protein [Lutibaculum baratangense]|nr:carbon monoxide dehydrogenase subunit G [Lutibaculum baratangense]
MIIEGEYLLPAERQEVWEALTDPVVLQRCIPRCEAVDRLSETEFEGIVALKLGPLTVRLRGVLTLSELDPPRSYRMVAKARGGLAGFAEGSSHVRLEAAGEGTTRLIFEGGGALGGRLAYLAEGLVEGAARSVADRIFGDLRAYLQDNRAREADEKDRAPNLGS